MDFDRLRALVWTIDEGSVTAAALRLHRTQPAVTRLLRTLEESVGRPLIDRSARPLVPTPAGRRVIETARQILQMADTLMAPGGAEPVPRLALRLGMSRSLLWHLSGHLFASPPKHLRELDYRIRTGPGSDIYRAFCRKEIDCAAILMPLDWCPSIRCSVTLVREERLVMIAPKRSRKTGAGNDSSEAGGHPWILNHDGCGVRDALAKALARQGHRLQVRYEVDAAPQDHIAMVASGLGVSVVPAGTLRHHAQSPGVTQRPLDDELVMGVWLLASDPATAIDGLTPHLRRVLGGATARSSRLHPHRHEAVPRVA